MAISLGDNIKLALGLPNDARYYSTATNKPWTGVTEVNTLLTGGIGGLRYTGLTVNIAGVEYWYKDGIGDGDLVPKELGGGGTITGGTNGLGITGANICLGGALLNNTSLTGNYTLTFSGDSKLNTHCGYQISGCTILDITSDNQIAIGCNALSNTLIGYGGGSIGIGSCALCSQTQGFDNVAIGCLALAGVTEAYNNIGIGYLTLANSTGTTAGSNIAIGSTALRFNKIGYYNIAIGVSAGSDSSNQSCNTTGCNNVFIGAHAGQLENNSYRLHIHSSDGITPVANPLIYGEFDNGIVCINDKLVTKEFQMLSGASVGYVLTSDASGNATWQAFSSGGGSGENVTKLIEQTSHGFDVMDVIGWSGGTYNLAVADGTYDGEIVGLITKCHNADCFDLTQAGYVTGLTSLSANATYFLSDTTAGLLTSTKPTETGHIVKSVIVADSTTSGWVLPYPAYLLSVSSGTTGTSLSEFTITGDSTNTGFTVVHGLNKQFVMVQVVENTTPYATIYTDVLRPNANCVCITFDSPPANGTQYKILIIN